MEKVEFSPIKNFYDALKVKNIRNEGRTFMTNDSSKIKFSQQLKWYFGTYRDKNKKRKMFCYLLKENGVNAGFGLVRENKGKFWITGGLSPNFRGKGLGFVLFEETVKAVPAKEVWLEVLDSNIAARKIYDKLGFKNVKTKNNNVIIMKLTKSKISNEKI